MTEGSIPSITRLDIGAVPVAEVTGIFFASPKRSLEGNRPKNTWKPVRLRRSVFFIPKPSIKQAYFGFRHKKNQRKTLVFRCFLRRERDSNPRYLAVRWFSRPVHSTTLPSLQRETEASRVGGKFNHDFMVCKEFWVIIFEELWKLE